MKLVKPLAAGRWILSQFAVVLLFFFAKKVVAPLVYGLPGSPVQISRIASLRPLTSDELIYLSVYANVIVGSIPYLLSGVFASMLMNLPGLLLSTLLLLAFSHFCYPIPWAPFVFDYVRMSTFALGVTLGLGGRELLKLWRPRQ